MTRLPQDIERAMRRLFNSLGEKDRRHYAAVEALKLGHGGIDYIAGMLGCDPKTIRQGQLELQDEQPLEGDRERKKGVDGGR